MPNIDFLQILRDAWKMAWKNRFLWWFGWFILLPGIINPDYFPNPNESSGLKTAWQKVADEYNLTGINPEDFFLAHAGTIILITTIILIFFVSATLLSILGRGALIKSTQRLLRNEPTNFKIGFQDGKKYFGKIFFIMLATGLTIILCVIILALPLTILFATKNYIPAAILLFFAIIIIIPLIIIYKYIQAYAFYYVVLADLRPWPAIENAYAIFRKNILASIIMSLLFIPFGIAMLIALIPVLILTLIIFVPIGIALYAAFQKIGLVIAAVSGIFGFLAIFSLPSAVLTTFYEIAWVLFFHKIATPKKLEAVEAVPVAEKKESTKIQTPDAIKTADKTE
jgi:hypothetical protein